MNFYLQRALSTPRLERVMSLYFEAHPAGVHTIDRAEQLPDYSKKAYIHLSLRHFTGDFRLYVQCATPTIHPDRYRNQSNWLYLAYLAETVVFVRRTSVVKRNIHGTAYHPDGTHSEMAITKTSRSHIAIVPEGETIPK